MQIKPRFKGKKAFSKNRSILKMKGSESYNAIITLPSNMMPVQTRSLNTSILRAESYKDIDTKFRTTKMNANLFDVKNNTAS